MQSKAKTIPQYLKSLPKDRRAIIETVRKTILKHLPKGYKEVMNWGAITYEVPLSVYPDTYNKQPLMYAGLASQKNHVGIYLCNVYSMPAVRRQLTAGFKAAGKKLDMGKSCIRFKKLDDLPLDVIGKVVAATPVKAFVAYTKSVHAKRKK